MKRKFNGSVRKKVTFILVSAIVAVLLLAWLFNRVLLERYYIRSKTKSLEQTYDYIIDAIETQKYKPSDSESNSAGNLILDDLKAELDEISIKKNLVIIVYSKEYGSYISRVEGKTKDYFNMRIRDYIENDDSLKKNKIEAYIVKEGKYQIYRVADASSKTRYIELLDADNEKQLYILISTNIENLSESAGIANRFLAYVGIVATVIGGLVMFFISKTFSNPIKELNYVAREMSELNFDIKYTGKSNDEIGELGASINVLSERLEDTISELKSVNNELKNDIEKKTQIEEMRKEFLSNISHELKTPISLILGYAEGLKDNISGDEETRNFYCDVISDEASKMNQMVKKILQLIQLESEKSLEYERFDIVSMIKAVIDSNSILLEQKGAKLILNSNEKSFVWAEEYSIEEVFSNYLSNAINHLDYDKIIEINVIETAVSTRVSVFNSGDPIPEQDLDKIWTKFYKVDKARTREYGGSGIGLSIVKATMDKHNSKFGAINHSNGVEFWFEVENKA